MPHRAQIPDGDGLEAVALEEGETLDQLFGGRVRLIQRRRGYRFSVDPLLLAAWTGRPSERAVDLGTGCGIVSLLLALRGCGSVVGVEVQQALFDLAVRNVGLNELSGRIELLRADLRALRGLLRPASFDLVVSNPPYVAARAGNLNAVHEKAIARHELLCTPPELAAAARALLREGGSLKLVFPAARIPELFAASAEAGFTPRRMRLVYPLASRPAKMVLFEAVKGGNFTFEALPPLHLFSEPGKYTSEALEVLTEVRASLDAVPSPRETSAAHRLPMGPRHE